MRSNGRTNSDDCLRESIARIRSIAAVHNLLSAQNVRMADIKDLAEMIVENCVRGAGSPAGVGILVQGESVLLPSKQATALALVLTELINNALEHAFDARGRNSPHLSSRNPQERWWCRCATMAGAFRTVFP